MSLRSTLHDALLPNRAFTRRAGLRGWLLRIALLIVGIFLIVHFGVQQHQSLR